MAVRPQFFVKVPVENSKSGYFPVSLKETLSVEASEFAKPYKILVLSNINGNFRFLYKLLRINGVINSRYEWIFSDGHLVLIGDCFDKLGQSIECLWLIYSLEDRAKRAGGYIHFLLGDKEILNMNGDWRYEHPKYAYNSGDTQLKNTALYDANLEISRWLKTKNIIEQIGDILFVHGGIAAEINGWSLSLNEINHITQSYYCSEKQIFEDPFLYLIYHSEKSPIWYQGYYRGELAELQIEQTLERFCVSTIVTGHTRAGHIASFLNGKVINGNTSKKIGMYEALVVEDNVFYRVNANGLREIVHSLVKASPF